MSQAWKKWTEARIQLGRKGASLPSEQQLQLLEAQALARDSLWRNWDTQSIQNLIHSMAWPCLKARTPVTTRQEFLMRPDLGRKLQEAELNRLKQFATDPNNGVDTEIVFCISDGLSTDAMQNQLPGFLKVLLPLLQQESFFRLKPYPFVLIPWGRVAAGDGVCAAFNARLCVMLIGERPGLSAHDSLGIYLSYEAKPGTQDSQRNCISNIREPAGLSHLMASQQLLYLMRESLRLRLTGVELKLDLPEQPLQSLPLNSP